MIATRNLFMWLPLAVIAPFLLYPASAFLGSSRHLNVPSQETSTSLNEPFGISYSGSSSNELRLNSLRKHAAARVLSAMDDDKTINQVTFGESQTNANKKDDNRVASEQEFHSSSQKTGIDQTKQSDQTFSSVVRNDTIGSRSQKRNDDMAAPDTDLRRLKDQLIRAKIYLSLPGIRNNPHFLRELRLRMKEIQRALVSATEDSKLPWTANDKMKAMEQTLAKGKQMQDNCAALRKLRAMLHSTEEQTQVYRKKTAFLTQLTAKTLPRGLHCLPIRLTTEYYSLNYSHHKFPNQKKLEDPRLYHYALFSDNVLAAAVVINSTVTNAKDPSKHVFHIVTDRLNYAAMRMWFLLKPPSKATIQVQNVGDFRWLNSSYSPVLKQLGSPSMIDYYFRADRANSDSNLKFRNPKYLSILNHLRFYIPEIFPKLKKVLFLDDDIVVQRELTGLWSLDLMGKVNGAVETCKGSFHRFDRYLNFSNPLIAKNFDPNACGWAYGMNIFDLEEWKRQNITELYHRWQELNNDRQLWKLGTLPPGLITFWQRTYPLDKSWHVLGLGYNSTVNQRDIERAAVVHYNGNMKPWLEIGIPKYQKYWAKYVAYDNAYLQECNINP